jgi:hypothetical protein
MLTRDDVQNFGTDLIDFTQRAAVQAVGPHLQALDQQNADLRQRLAVEARRNLDAIVARAIPNYQDVDRDPNWLSWLAQIDPLSGRQRQQLLNEAISDSDASRVLGFFRQFQAGRASSPAPSHAASSLSPGRARSVPSSGKVYTRTEIAKLFEQHRRGAYVGREDAWARQEADIVAAGAEGRVLNPDIVTK